MASVASRSHSLFTSSLQIPTTPLPPPVHSIDDIQGYIDQGASRGGLCRNTAVTAPLYNKFPGSGASEIMGDYTMSGPGPLHAAPPQVSPSKLSPLMLGQGQHQHQHHQHHQHNRSPSLLSGSDGMAGSVLDGTTGAGGASSYEDVFEAGGGAESQFAATPIDDDFLTPQRYLFPPHHGDAFNSAHGMRAAADQRYWSDDDRDHPQHQQRPQQQQHMGQFMPFAMSESPTADPPPHPQAPLFDTARMFHSGPGTAGWSSSIRGEASSAHLQIPVDHHVAPLSSGNSSGSEASGAEMHGGGGSGSGSNNKTASMSTRRVACGKVVKKKSSENAATPAAAAGGNFVIMTPTSINAQSGKPNPFDCFDAMGNGVGGGVGGGINGGINGGRASRGRKGPLASTAKKNALQVRRQGACFCCHVRKVKCDMERPCRSCTRLMAQVPRVVCWQFQDFLGILLPEFLRGHLRKEEVARFVEQQVGEQPMTAGMTAAAAAGGRTTMTTGSQVQGGDFRVELYSGPWFGAKLAVQARIFRAKTAGALRHWHANAAGGRVDLRSCDSVPIGMDLAGGPQRDDLRRRVRVYVQDIVHEPAFAEQVTDTLKSTRLPTKTLRIVQRYANRTNSPIVNKALSVYAMHYVLTRHLCLTRDSVVSLGPMGLVARDAAWVTSRVLSRQVKSTVDDLLAREVQQLFDLFSRSLKPKARREWAPCLAAFLVLCLFMEGVEAAAETYVVSRNEIRMRAAAATSSSTSASSSASLSSPSSCAVTPEAGPELGRSVALEACREVENMPFRQFAYQFHHIYMTHTRDPNSRAFNPLFDGGFAAAGELDGPALELVHGLKELFYGPDWLDMQFLADDEMILNRDEHPFPLDPAYMYNGRLLARFLLSFTDERYIFGAHE
ncbi:hypothetical protein N3K66_001913 [Trichothecium roseum]|uniref:Uncharacterized protein n=1 Tax=Trichothecium roseum TaxID=47278 RepID=A0ACC0V7W5_9HYPO|nr:hypothetical protein N3K66_001913 [Trichothecium roseum]